MEDMLSKVRALRAECDRRGLCIDIQVDGGIGPKTAPLVAEAGATVAVVGSALFGAQDPKAVADAIHAL